MSHRDVIHAHGQAGSNHIRTAPLADAVPVPGDVAV
jgi:hypothetical protein